MKTLTALMLLFGILFSTNIVSTQEEAVFKKYDIISGYVEYKISGLFKGKAELFFEEYGSYNSSSVTVQIETSGKMTKISSLEIETPDSIYSIALLQATGTKGAVPDNTRAKEIYEIEKGDFEKVKAQLMKDDGYIKEGNGKILDKDCIIWEKNEDGILIRKWVWKGIELKILMKSRAKKLSKVAVKFVEEEPIPFSKFEPPSGIEWDECSKIIDLD